MRKLISLVVLSLAAAPAVADEGWGPPTSEYSAVLTFTDRRGETLAHRIHHTQRRQRLDYKVGERQEIAIVDQEAAAVFVLYPGLKRYRKSPLVQPEYDFGIGRAGTKRERLGEEGVAGQPAVKYRVEAKTAQGQEFKGVAWLTRERILVKLDGEVKQGRRTRRFAMLASEIKIGAVDPAVFRIPADFAPFEPKRN